MRLAAQVAQTSLKSLDQIEIVEAAEPAAEGYYDDGRPAFEWSVHLVGDARILDAIDRVEYELHPTFDSPNQVVRTRENGFKLKNVGWGTFPLTLLIHLKDGQAVTVTYLLTFNETNRERISAMPLG